MLDDGELDDVQEILDDLRIAYGRVRGGAIARNTPPPTKLLISTPRRIDAVRAPARGDGGGDGLTRIVVVSEDSTTLRAKLRDIGFDYLVRRPVHPEALRLLLLHCLYTGDERRREPRVPIGFEISFRTGMLPRRATLADLSSRGCRLLSRFALEPGKRITLQIPQAVGSNESLTLRGRVIRMSLDENLGPDGPYSAGVMFEDVSAEARQEIEWLLEERAQGPAVLQPAGASPPGAEAEPMSVDLEVDVRMAPEGEADAEPAAPKAGPKKKPARGKQGKERRRSRRGSYAKKVPAFGSRALRVLVARDLSQGGMRVEQFSGLSIGDRLHLAIYGSADQEPFLVWATVSRDDGANGMALVFDEIHPQLAEQLEKVVADLPAVESLHDDEARAMGTVVTEILES
jgi:c-di-GMP-binding flagellar brake protein YcgR